MRRGKRREDLKKDKRAVSLVIGVILMFALTLLVQSPKVTSSSVNNSKLTGEIEIGTTLKSKGMKAGGHHVVSDTFKINTTVGHHVVNDTFKVNPHLKIKYPPLKIRYPPLKIKIKHTYKINETAGGHVVKGTYKVNDTVMKEGGHHVVNDTFKVNDTHLVKVPYEVNATGNITNRVEVEEVPYEVNATGDISDRVKVELRDLFHALKTKIFLYI